MEPFIANADESGPAMYRLSGWMKTSPGLTAGFTGRTGGAGQPPHASLNVALHVGDDARTVQANRERVVKALGWPFEAWTCAEQVHGSRVYRVEAADRGSGRLERRDAIADSDALMTDVPGILLTSFYADCVPLYFYDPEHGAVALAHAGWRGTAGRIGAATVGAMQQAYGTRKERVRAAIGPAIGLCCYEVDAPVLEQIGPLAAELEAVEGRSALVEPSAPGRARIDLKEMNRRIMIKAGIMPTHIELTGRCTACRTDRFFSHRAEAGRTGRMASWIGMEAR
ncbi:peptidoglycan editing factor PgeF [Paenibacillus sp. IB182496]|uniref:Purine nucleoside phosphorylase n=1 Tax=Paenibacillus sabuli TaxID=2772509 RepID=A0A927BVK8_9BACL|nr:peptidoglycan editing factor PgeF [Paenibacillus sabuli]MBD2846279.1 peptidoglycan editing factor PgeF [Paenibacillus sabuli]